MITLIFEFMGATIYAMCTDHLGKWLKEIKEEQAEELIHKRELISELKEYNSKYRP